jgi:isoaspartyl peptidase/L-asparaginase-like protein (Ntn-hydrolase superfamily)
MRPNWVILIASGFACATSADDPMEVPQSPILYRAPDCPAAIRAPVARPLARLGKRKRFRTFVSGTVPGALALTHGGAASRPELSNGPQSAANKALGLLLSDAPALEAAIEATVVLEDDPRFNAGTGANIRLDGATIQMDASLMTQAGEFAAVAAIERVKNPIRAARLVLDSPHVLLAGEGATRFAHRLGLPDEVPTSTHAAEKYEERLNELGERSKDGTLDFDWRRYWNYEGEMPEAMKHWREHGDTVGAVTRDRDGAFAATLSTGGTSVTLDGRVGDVPVYGAGLFAGPYGAVACTGHGETIIARGVARRVYEALASGTPVQDAVYEALADFPPRIALGVIALDQFGWVVASNNEMAYGLAAEEDVSPSAAHQRE